MRDKRVAAPGVTSTRSGRTEELASRLNHNQRTASIQPAPQVAPARRRCPGCAFVAVPSFFVPVPPVAGERGLAWRRCPQCGARGLLTSFERGDGGVLPVGGGT